MRRCLVVFILLFCGVTAYAQDELYFGNTGTTDRRPTYKPKNKDHRHKRMIQWIKNDAQNLLIGNRCMEEVTNDMGFQYLIQLKGQPGHHSEAGRLIHNFGAKLGIFFRNGPFWKFKLKKKRKECRRLTGDYVG